MKEVDHILKTYDRIGRVHLGMAIIGGVAAVVAAVSMLITL